MVITESSPEGSKKGVHRIFFIQMQVLMWKEQVLCVKVLRMIIDVYFEFVLSVFNGRKVII
jgi:hypothetical protein